MAGGVVEQEDRDTRRQESHDVGNHEGAAAVGVGDAWEAPDVSEPHR